MYRSLALSVNNYADFFTKALKPGSFSFHEEQDHEHQICMNSRSQRLWGAAEIRSI